MGVRHRELAGTPTPLEGVQFHPESILTEHGHAMLKNFWRLGHETPRGRSAQRHRHPADAGDARGDGAAEVGDDVFGDDPTVNALQERIAALLGKEAALFVPSGTQGNLVASWATAGRGDEYIVGQMAHTYRWEGGGAAVLGSVQPQPLAHRPTARWRWPTSRPRSSPTTRTSRRSRLLCLENTLGGKVLPLA